MPLSSGIARRAQESLHPVPDLFVDFFHLSQGIEYHPTLGVGLRQPPVAVPHLLVERSIEILEAPLVGVIGTWDRYDAALLVKRCLDSDPAQTGSCAVSSRNVRSGNTPPVAMSLAACTSLSGSPRA